MPEQQMKIARTGSFYYIGFQPPIDGGSIDDLPKPNGLDFAQGVEAEEDGSVTLGYDAVLCGFNEQDPSSFISYAEEIAAHLGNVAFDKTLRYIGPGSLFSSDNLAETPKY